MPGWRVRRARLARLAALTLLAVAWLVATGPAAGAHALLRSSDPADGTSVDKAPSRVVMVFTERPEPRLSGAQLLDSDGRPVATGKVEAVPGKPLELVLPLRGLPDGTYTVTWRVVSRDDGHVTGGAFAFGVGVAAPAAGSATPAAGSGTPSPSVLPTAGRLALYCGLVLLLGAAVSGLLVDRGRLQGPVSVLLGVGAGLAVVGMVARVAAERSAVRASLGELLATGAGRSLIWLAAGVVATVAASAAVAARPAARRRLLLLGAAAAVTMLLEVMAGHAATPSSLRPLNVLAQWLHIAAVGAWAGGLAWLLASLLGREPSGEPGADALVSRGEAVRRFSTLALPTVVVIAVTGVARALDLAGGWHGLLDTSFGRVLDVKTLLFLAVLGLAALNRYRLVPALSGAAGKLGAIRRSVAGEAALAVLVLLAAALLTQLPPGKFALAQQARQAIPNNVEVQGSDFTTSVRLALTVTPGTPGPNTFTAKVSDYDDQAAFPATRVALRFSLRDRPEVAGNTLELAKGGDGLWRGRGSQLSIQGRWVIIGLVEGSGSAYTVPLDLQTRGSEPRVTVSRAPGQPDLYTITLPTGGTLQAYVDPGKAGANTVHFTFFTAGGDEQTIDAAHARMTTPSGASQTLRLLRLSDGHFAANADLGAGRSTFAINATTNRGVPVDASFSQQIQ
jgi:copper transport protein